MRRGGLIVGVAVALAAPGGVAHAAVAAGQRPAVVKTVTAFGVAVVVPRSWPVIDFRHQAAGCIRLDQHAVYIGQPARPTCPAHLVGSVAAVQIRAATSLDRATGNTMPRAGRAGAVYRDGGAASPTAVFLLGGGRTAVVVTRSDTPAGRAVVASVRSAAGAPATPAAAGTAPPPAVTAPPQAGYFTGEGFDTCSAPSAGAMQAWLASRYRAVNIYMGGSDRGCAQPNLTAAWVSTVTAQGWTLIPTYVGLQAPCWGGSGAKINPGSAAAEGASSADDAANGMAALGLGQGNPVYFDMEAYDTGNSGCVSAVETFLDSWTAELHNRGYVSGVYSSAASGITNLVQETGNPSYHLPDDIWFAHWDNSDSVYGDPYIPDSDWDNHQRIHQYAGGHDETYGGVTINIDNDAVDGATAPVGPPPNGTFVQLQGTTGVYEMAGGAPLYVSNWANVGGPHPVDVLSAAQWAALAPVPANGTFISDNQTGMVYEVAGGAPLYVSNWANVGGPQPTVGVDDWDIANITNPAAHLNRVPANGTFIRDNQTGMVYEIAGGAPLYVSNWANVGGQQPAVGVDDWDIANIASPAAHLRRVPANGTFIRDPASKAVYVVAGGAPLYLDTCAPLNGCPGAVNIDPADITRAGAGQPWSHLRRVPANGTFIRNAVSGWAGEVAGGKLFHLTARDCARLRCAASWVNVVPATVSAYLRAHRAIANGTFVRNVRTGWTGEAVGGKLFGLNAAECARLACGRALVRTTPDVTNAYQPRHRQVSKGTFVVLVSVSGHRADFRAAGGALLPVGNCAVLGGCKHAVVTAAHAVASYRAAHRWPGRGTILEGKPSRTFWVIRGRYRYRARTHRGAVAVDDSTLRHFTRK